MARRRGSATALKASEVVAARAMGATLHAHMGICQALFSSSRRPCRRVLSFLLRRPDGFSWWIYSTMRRRSSTAAGDQRIWHALGEDFKTLQNCRCSPLRFESPNDQPYSLAGRVICEKDAATAYVFQNEQTPDFLSSIDARQHRLLCSWADTPDTDSKGSVNRIYAL